MHFGDACHLEVFDHRCLRSVGKIEWSNRVSNLEGREHLISSYEVWWTSLVGSRVLFGEHSSTIPCHIFVPLKQWKKPRVGQ